MELKGTLTCGRQMEEKESIEETEPVARGRRRNRSAKTKCEEISKQGVINNLNYCIKVKKESMD